MRNEGYPHLLSKSIRNEVDYITKLPAAMYSTRGAVNPSERASAAIMSHISITLEKKLEVICRMEDGQTHSDECRRNLPSTVP